MRKLALSLMLAISIGAATTASSQSPQSAAPTVDPAWKVPEVIAFIGLKKGDSVADIVGARLTASLARCPDCGVRFVYPVREFERELAETSRLRLDPYRNMVRLKKPL